MAAELPITIARKLTIEPLHVGFWLTVEESSTDEPYLEVQICDPDSEILADSAPLNRRGDGRRISLILSKPNLLRGLATGLNALADQAERIGMLETMRARLALLGQEVEE